MTDTSAPATNLDAVAASMLQEAPAKPSAQNRANDFASNGGAEPERRKRQAAETDIPSAEARSQPAHDSETGDDGVYEDDEYGDSEDTSDSDEEEGAEAELSEEGDEDSETSEESDEDFDTPKYVDADDDAIVKLNVDGKEVEVSLSELKKRYAGEGAIENRLREATELKRQTLTQLTTNREQLTNVVAAVGQMLFTPTVKAPPVELAHTNFQEYTVQKALYDEEQKIIADRQNAVAAVLSEIDNRSKQTMREIKAAEAARLRQVLPVLADPVKGPKFIGALHKTAMETYGFTKEELNAAADHRLFVMAADAMRYRMAAQKGAKTVKPKPTTAKVLKKAVRNTPNTAATSKARQQQKAMEKARKTGSVDDVAATMIIRR